MFSDLSPSTNQVAEQYNESSPTPLEMTDRDYRYGFEDDREQRRPYMSNDSYQPRPEFGGNDGYRGGNDGFRGGNDGYRNNYGPREGYQGGPPGRPEKPEFWTPEKTQELRELAESKRLPDGTVDFAEIAQALGASKDSCMNKYVSLNEPVWTDTEMEELADMWQESNGKMSFEEATEKLQPHTLHGIRMKLETICKNRMIVPTYRIPREGALPCLHEMHELCEYAIRGKRFDICDKMLELVEELKKQLKG